MLTTKPWFGRHLRHPARKRSGSILGHNTHIFTDVLTFPGPTRGRGSWEREGLIGRLTRRSHVYSVLAALLRMYITSKKLVQYQYFGKK